MRLTQHEPCFGYNCPTSGEIRPKEIRIECDYSASGRERKMKRLACRDLGMDCDHIVSGSTIEEVKQKAMAHAKEKHGDTLKTMSSPAQMAEMEKLMESKIK
jgi:predicted small metal-binding protein